MNKLNREEQEILYSHERAEVRSVSSEKKELARHKKIAENSFKKDSRINIRIASRDLRALQK